MKPLLTLLCLATGTSLFAQKETAPPAYDKSVPKPTMSEVRYGEHERHVLDFWQAESDAPTPLVFIIHGGGWNGGTKERAGRFADISALLKAGISAVSINYRLVPQAVEAGIEPPVKAPLHDAARALQFVRSKATEWNLDKDRIGAAGGSAGACSSLWLAFHDEMADPESRDPVARESRRGEVIAAAAPSINCRSAKAAPPPLTVFASTSALMPKQERRPGRWSRSLPDLSGCAQP